MGKKEQMPLDFEGGKNTAEEPRTSSTEVPTDKKRPYPSGEEILKEILRKQKAAGIPSAEYGDPYDTAEETLAAINAELKKSGEPSVELGDSHIWSIREKNKKKNKKHG